jgi:hypothetical protein
MDCTTSTVEIDGATLVTVVLQNPHDRPVRVRVENDLAGPVWPPRKRGRPEPGWDEEGYEGVLDPGERTALGYAVPTTGESPAAHVATAEPATGSTADRNEAPVAAQFRDPRPPRGVLSPVTPPKRGVSR